MLNEVQPTRASKNRQYRWLFGVLPLTLLPLLAWGLWVQTYRVPYGASIADTGLSALRWDVAMKRLVEYKRSRQERTMTWAAGSRACTATPKQMGIEIDVGATLKRLAEASKQRGFWSRIAGAASPLLPELTINQSAFLAWVDACEQSVISDRPVIGRLVAKESKKDSSILLEESKPGRRIEREKLVGLLRQALVQLDDSSLVLPLVNVAAYPSHAALEQAREHAGALLSKPIVLLAEGTGKKLTLLRSELAKMLEWKAVSSDEVKVELSRPAFERWLGSRRHRVEQPARNATFTVDGLNRFTLVPEMSGNDIAVDALFPRLADAIATGQQSVAIPFQPTSLPKLRSADIENLNIHEYVGGFTTKHACCQPRVQNIHRIADLVNGTIVMPGATFSLNEFVGPRTLERGFVAAPSIQDGDMMDTIGGGISQFATTFYNAAMRSGYEILERQAHSYWFERYPMGHEATLTWPKPDVVIRNDTASGLLILTSYDDRSITVKFYGDKEGRHVTWAVSPRSDIVLPKTEFLPNPELEADEDKVKEGGCIGWTVTTTRTVIARDGSRHEDKRKVIYKPRIRRVEVHPCKIPPGEPGATGEKCPKPKEESDNESSLPSVAGNG